MNKGNFLFLLVTSLLTITSCNKQEEKQHLVYMNSDTLDINVSAVNQNQDLKAKIYTKNVNEKLPYFLDKVMSGTTEITNYTYSKDTGDFLINASEIKGDVIITATSEKTINFLGDYSHEYVDGKEKCYSFRLTPGAYLAFATTTNNKKINISYSIGSKDGERINVINHLFSINSIQNYYFYFSSNDKTNINDTLSATVVPVKESMEGYRTFDVDSSLNGHVIAFPYAPASDNCNPIIVNGANYISIPTNFYDLSDTPILFDYTLKRFIYLEHMINNGVSFYTPAQSEKLMKNDIYYFVSVLNNIPINTISRVEISVYINSEQFDSKSVFIPKGEMLFYHFDDLIPNKEYVAVSNANDQYMAYDYKTFQPLSFTSQNRFITKESGEIVLAFVSNPEPPFEGEDIRLTMYPYEGISTPKIKCTAIDKNKKIGYSSTRDSTICYGNVKKGHYYTFLITTEDDCDHSIIDTAYTRFVIKTKNGTTIASESATFKNIGISSYVSGYDSYPSLSPFFAEEDGVFYMNDLCIEYSEKLNEDHILNIELREAFPVDAYLTNIALSDSDDISTNVTYVSSFSVDGFEYKCKLVADEGTQLPSSIDVYINDEHLISDIDYTFIPGFGVLTITNIAKIKGTIKIIAKATYEHNLALKVPTNQHFKIFEGKIEIHPEIENYFTIIPDDNYRFVDPGISIPNIKVKEKNDSGFEKDVIIDYKLINGKINVNVRPFEPNEETKYLQLLFVDVEYWIKPIEN